MAPTTIEARPTPLPDLAQPRFCFHPMTGGHVMHRTSAQPHCVDVDDYEVALQSRA
jgi:hypothetical protein